MANELQTKRIIDLAKKTAPEDGDNLAVDNATSGTRRITWANLLDNSLSDDTKAAPAGVTGQAIEDAKTTFTDLGDGNIAVNYDEDVPTGTETPLKSIRFPLLLYKYTVPVIDPTLTQSGQAADALVTGKIKSGLNVTAETIIYNANKLFSDESVDFFDNTDADFLTDYGYYGNTNNIVSYNYTYLTGYIPVTKGEIITIFYNYNGIRDNFLTSQRNTRKIGFYSANKEWIKTVSDFSEYSSGVLPIDDYGYVRFQFFGNGSFLEIYKNSVKKINLENVKDSMSFSDLSKLMLTGKSINWINPYAEDYLVGYGYSGTTNTLVEASIYSITNYIRVYKGKKITVPYSDNTSFFTSTKTGVRKIAFFDSNKTWIKTVSISNELSPYDSNSVDFGIDGYIRLQFLNIYPPASMQIEDFNEIGRLFIEETKSPYVPPKWYAIGDSITDGRYSYITSGGGVGVGTDHEAYYGYIAAQILGMEMIEYGYGGMGYINVAGDSTTLLDVLDIDFDDPTLITVCLGTNDTYATTGDENSTALDGTFSGAVRNACEVLGTKYPNAQIIIMSPINANNNGTQATIWKRKAALNNNLDAQREILKHWCDVYNIKFLDMTVECPINVFNIVSLFPDQLHPSKQAHLMIGKWLAGALPFRNI